LGQDPFILGWIELYGIDQEHCAEEEITARGRWEERGEGHEDVQSGEHSSFGMKSAIYVILFHFDQALAPCRTP
jgi:hypothetical protein